MDSVKPGEPTPGASMPPRFCTSCGAALESAMRFCTRCGAATAAVRAPLSSSPIDKPSEVMSAASGASVSAPQKSGSKIAAVIAGVVALVVFCGLGSCAYVAYQAKKRITHLQQGYRTDDVAEIAKAVSGDGANGNSEKLPNWGAASPVVLAAPSSKIPLCTGLTVVTAVNQPFVGDYESIKSFDSVTPNSAHMKYSAQIPDAPDLTGIFGFKTQASQPPQPARTVSCARTILQSDLANSQDYREYFCEAQEERYPGTTAIGISQATLNQLKTTGTADFQFGVNGLQELISSFQKLVAAAGSRNQGQKGRDSSQGLQGLDLSPEKSCALRRVESFDLAVPVLVNNQPVNLPAVHAACTPADRDQEVNFYFLDDPDNALALAWQLAAKNGGLQVIKITWPAANQQPTQQLEKQLANEGRAQVYGIYFDFASDQLRPESAEVLKEITQVMHDHPDWKLSVEGHTDNIGGDAFNMDLSRRRAEAVKTALTLDYQISPERLTTAGFGATRPVASNDTMEGRARNRRVELVRQ